MEMSKLLSIVDSNYQPLVECGQNQLVAPAQQMVNMSLNLNAQGIEQIKDLLGLINNHEEPKFSEPQPLTPIQSKSDDITTIGKLAGIEIEPESKQDVEIEGSYSASTTPDETYFDTDFMTRDMAGGMNKEKKQVKHGYKQGDNPLAMDESFEQLKNTLLQEFEDFKNR